MVWGTKQGLQPFFSFGVELSEDSQIAMHGRNDLRNHNFKTSDAFSRTFYGIDESEGHRLVHQFKTIIDDTERPGFIAVTLVIPVGKRMNDGMCLQLLNHLTDKFSESYLQPKGSTYRIIRKNVEDTSLFGSILREPIYRLSDEMAPSTSGKVARACFTYSNQEELSSVFDRLNRSEIRAVEKLFLLSESMSGILPQGMSFSAVPAPVNTHVLEIRVNASDGLWIEKPRVYVTMNGSFIKPIISVDGVILIERVRYDDRVDLKIEYDGYKSQNIRYPYDFSLNSGMDAHPERILRKTVRLEKLEKVSDGGFKPIADYRERQGRDGGHGFGRHKRKEPSFLARFWIPIVLSLSVISVISSIIWYDHSIFSSVQSTPLENELDSKVPKQVWPDVASPSSNDSMARRKKFEDTLTAFTNRLNYEVGKSKKNMITLKKMGDSIESFKTTTRNGYNSDKKLLAKFDSLIGVLNPWLQKSGSNNNNSNRNSSVNNPNSNNNTTKNKKNKTETTEN
jgi:hypothetical protein